MSDHGEIHLRNFFSYQSGLTARMLNLVRAADPSGMPRKTPTLLATVVYETVTLVLPPPITCTNNTASGAYKTICRMELRATRMAQYSSSPPARPVQMRTWRQS